MQNKPFLYIVVGCVLLGAILTLVQMWTQIFEWSAFIKILGTLGIVLLVAAFLLLIKLDFGDTKKLKDQNYLD
jgi:hypothetical protein